MCYLPIRAICSEGRWDVSSATDLTYEEFEGETWYFQGTEF